MIERALAGELTHRLTLSDLVRLVNIKPTQLNPSSFDFGNTAIARRLENLTQRSLSKTLSPCAVLSVTTATGETWSGGVGFSNLSTRKATQPGDRFQIGSITKTFTATVILQLVQENKVNIDDKLSKWLAKETKGIILNADRISIRQMLNHTSGIADYVSLSTYREAIKANPTKQWKPQEVINLVKGVESTNVPGKKFSYSNTNYYLLGLVIERATGSTYVHEIQTRILEPLGMENTFVANQELVSGGYAHGYIDLNENGKIDIAEGEDATKVNVSSFGAGGGMVSNTTDLSRFIQALFSGELLSPQTLILMKTPPSLPNAFYGLGIFKSPVPEQKGWWGHNGATFAYSSTLFSDPQTGTTSVTLENTDSIGFGDQALQGLNRVLTEK